MGCCDLASHLVYVQNTFTEHIEDAEVRDDNELVDGFEDYNIEDEGLVQSGELQRLCSFDEFEDRHVEGWQLLQPGQLHRLCTFDEFENRNVEIEEPSQSCEILRLHAFDDFEDSNVEIQRAFLLSGELRHLPVFDGIENCSVDNKNPCQQTELRRLRTFDEFDDRIVHDEDVHCFPTCAWFENCIVEDEEAIKPGNLQGLRTFDAFEDGDLEDEESSQLSDLQSLRTFDEFEDDNIEEEALLRPGAVCAGPIQHRELQRLSTFDEFEYHSIEKYCEYVHFVDSLLQPIQNFGNSGNPPKCTEQL